MTAEHKVNVFQSTFPRGERPVNTGVRVLRSEISIHVPAWGTTAIAIAGAGYQMDFNPRSRVGNDGKHGSGSSGSSISIHVPAWGTTRHRYAGRSTGRYFNPRSRVGNDQFPVTSFLTSFEFQSTFPRGERLWDTLDFENGMIISIHVPAWGTTDAWLHLHNDQVISIHVPAWGTTSLVFRNGGQESDFNPRSRVGNDCKFRQIFFVLFMQQAQSSTFIIPSLFSFCVIHFIFLIFLVRIPPSFYVCFWFAPT